jgi:hypothetical protein
MITVSDELAEAIERGGFQRYFVIDVSVDGERVLSDLRVSECELISDGTAKIRNQGSLVVEYSDELGRSVVPEDLNAWFTPYATRLNVSMVIKHSNIEEKVLRGTYLIRRLGDPASSSVIVGEQRYTVGSRIRVQLADEFRRIERERFPGPTSPTAATGWDELGLIAGVPLARNVADVNIPRAIPYDDDRLEAVHTIGRLLDGTPYMDPNNRLTIEPDVWGDETAPLLMGETGTVTKLTPDDLTDEAVYNQVIVRTYDDDQVRILATAEVTSGKLRYGGLCGKVPYFASSPWVTTEEDAQTYADAELPKRSTQPAVPYSVQAVIDPRREVGDVVPFTTEDGAALVGRIQHLTLADSGPMTALLLVNRD